MVMINGIGYNLGHHTKMEESQISGRKYKIKGILDHRKNDSFPNARLNESQQIV